MKEITLPVAELKTALTGLNKIIGRRTTLPVLETIRVTRDDQGKVNLTATDLDAFATYHIKDAQPGPQVAVLVSAEQLNRTVKNSGTKDSLTLLVEAPDQVKLRYQLGGNSVEQAVTTVPIAEWPVAPIIKQPPIALGPEFSVALKHALACCSEDSSRHVLRGACLDVTDKKAHYIVGTNGRVLFSANSFGFDLQKSVIIPDSKFMDWTDFLDSEQSLLTVEPPARKGDVAWIQLQTERWTYLAKEIDGEFPNWKQAVPLPDSRWTQIKLGDQAVKQLLQVTPKLPGGYTDNHAIRLRVTAGGLCVEGQHEDQKEWTSIPINEVQVTGKPVMVMLNRNYLLNALRFDLRTLEIESEFSPLVCSHAGKKMVIMPIRLSGSNPPSAKTPQPTSETKVPESTPSQPNSETPTERTPMPKVTPTPVTSTTTTEIDRVTEVVTRIDQIKETLKTVVRDLQQVGEIVKLADKEKRTSQKEIEQIRTQLRKLQNVTI